MTQDEPLVACGLCATLLDRANATQRQISTSQGVETIWICENCTRQSRGEQVRKYVMKQEKESNGRN